MSINRHKYTEYYWRDNHTIADLTEDELRDALAECIDVLEDLQKSWEEHKEAFFTWMRHPFQTWDTVKILRAGNIPEWMKIARDNGWKPPVG